MALAMAPAPRDPVALVRDARDRDRAAVGRLERLQHAATRCLLLRQLVLELQMQARPAVLVQV